MLYTKYTWLHNKTCLLPVDKFGVVVNKALWVAKCRLGWAVWAVMPHIPPDFQLFGAHFACLLRLSLTCCWWKVVTEVPGSQPHFIVCLTHFHNRHGVGKQPSTDDRLQKQQKALAGVVTCLGQNVGIASCHLHEVEEELLRPLHGLPGAIICRHRIFPPVGGFPPIERSHGSFLRSVQIRWENYRVYLTCERFSESNFANLPHASISFLHGTFSNGVNLFCFGHHHSVHGLAESTTKGSNPIVTCKSAVYGL